MKETGILFTSPMVRALPPGPKTMTRRALRDQTVVRNGAEGPELWTGFMGWQPVAAVFAEPGLNGNADARCPYGATGDRLWVRETFFAWGRWETRFNTKKGRDEWHFVDMTLESGRVFVHAADGMPAGYVAPHRGGVGCGWWKRPAIFMPRAASRITLEITEVRVERLQDISEADALVEGIAYGPTCDEEGRGGGYHWNRTHEDEDVYPTAVQAYRQLWMGINGADSWDANPWVWVVSFRRLP